MHTISYTLHEPAIIGKVYILGENVKCSAIY